MRKATNMRVRIVRLCAANLFWAIIIGAAVFPIRAFAQTATEPSPTASNNPTPASQSPHAPVWHNPPNTNYTIVDPCGGPKELLNKFGPTPCVYVAGEAMISAGYANINTRGNAQITGNGPPGFSTNLPLSGNANVYPQLLMVFGVTANSQLQFGLPSEVQVNSQHFGTFTATSEPSVNYKQRVFFSPRKYTQIAVDLGYTPPLEGGGINVSGPAYQIQLDVAQPLSTELTVAAWWTFKNALSRSLFQSSERGWSDPLGFYLAWMPAHTNLAVFPVVYHDFNPNRTAIIGEVAQLLSRHLSIVVAYGGAQTSSESNGAFRQVFNFATNSSPRVLTATLYFLINESNLPPQTPASSPSPTVP